VRVLRNLEARARENGEHANAESLYRRALDVDPKDVDTLYNLADLVEEQKQDFVEAEQLYRVGVFNKSCFFLIF
jgi:tetratricopeptide (TPR) repeat protein